MLITLQDTLHKFAELLKEEENVKKIYAGDPKKNQRTFINFGVKKLTFILQIQGLDFATAEKIARMTMEPADKFLTGLLSGMDEWIDQMKNNEQ